MENNRNMIIAGIIGRMLYRWFILFFVLDIHLEVAAKPNLTATFTCGFFGLFAVIWMGAKEFIIDLGNYDKENKDEDE